MVVTSRLAPRSGRLEGSTLPFLAVGE
jgi:hypothetical protein